MQPFELITVASIPAAVQAQAGAPTAQQGAPIRLLRALAGLVCEVPPRGDFGPAHGQFDAERIERVHSKLGGDETSDTRRAGGVDERVLRADGQRGEAGDDDGDPLQRRSDRVRVSEVDLTDRQVRVAGLQLGRVPASPREDRDR